MAVFWNITISLDIEWISLITRPWFSWRTHFFVHLEWPLRENRKMNYSLELFTMKHLSNLNEYRDSTSQVRSHSKKFREWSVYQLRLTTQSIPIRQDRHSRTTMLIADAKLRIVSFEINVKGYVSLSVSLICRWSRWRQRRDDAVYNDRREMHSRCGMHARSV